MKTANPKYFPCPYGVGDVYITNSEVDPATRWPGTRWTQIKDCYLMASGSVAAGSTGGNSEAILGQANLPLIEGHIYSSAGDAGSGHTGYAAFRSCDGAFKQENKNYTYGMPQYASAQGWPDGSLSLGTVHLQVGKESPDPISITPAYHAFNIWERTA